MNIRNIFLPLICSLPLMGYGAETPLQPEQREKSAFEQAIESQDNIETHERWTTIDGIQYREVEYKGEFFYVNFKDRGTAQLNCALGNSEFTPHKIDAEFELTKRTHAFLALLRDKCVVRHGHEMVEVKLDPKIGFTLPEDSKSGLKNKKVFLDPRKKGVGFKGDF